MTPSNTVASPAPMVPKVGLLYYNKYHDSNDPDGIPYYQCEWVGETFSVFSYEPSTPTIATAGNIIGRSEFILDNKQIQHWAEYHKPRKYERWVVWWNHSERDYLKHGANTSYFSNTEHVKTYTEGSFLVHRVDHLVLEFGTDGKVIEKK